MGFEGECERGGRVAREVPKAINYYRATRKSVVNFVLFHPRKVLTIQRIHSH